MSKEKQRRADVLQHRIGELEIYSRICPKHKFLLVQKLIAHYERILDSLNPNQSLVTA